MRSTEVRRVFPSIEHRSSCLRKSRGSGGGAPGGCPNDCSLSVRVEATQAVAPRAEKGRDNPENQRKSATISKRWKVLSREKGRVFRSICSPGLLNGVQEVAGSNPVAPTLQGQSGQQVPAGHFRALGTRSDPRGRVAGRDSTVPYQPIAFLGGLIRGCSHPPSGTAERDPL